MFLSPKIANMRSTKALRDYSALAKRQPTPGTLDDWERIFGWISGEKKTPNGLWPFDGVPWVSQRRRPSKRWGREFQLSVIWQVIIYKANKYGWYEKCGSLEVWVGGREIKEKEERQWSGKVWQRGSGAGWPVIHTGQLWCPCGKGKGPISAPTTLHSLLKFHLPRGFRLNWHLAPRFPPLWKSPENMPHNTKVCFFLANMSLSFVSDMLSNIPSSKKYSHLYRVAPTPLLLVKVGFRSSSDVHTKLLEERTRIAFGQSVPRAWTCWVGRWVGSLTTFPDPALRAARLLLVSHWVAWLAESNDGCLWFSVARCWCRSGLGTSWRGGCRRPPATLLAAQPRPQVYRPRGGRWRGMVASSSATRRQAHPPDP